MRFRQVALVASVAALSLTCAHDEDHLDSADPELRAVGNFATACGDDQTWENPTATQTELFGEAISVGAGKVLIGARNYSLPGLTNTGTAYVADIATGSIVEIPNPDPEISDLFGSHVAVVGSNYAIAAFRDDFEGDGEQTGTIYIFNPAGSLIQTIPNPAATGNTNFTEFGTYGSNLLVSNFFANGTVYLFDPVSGAQLISPLANPSAVVNDGFGGALAGGGRFIFVGSSGREQISGQAQKVYVFQAADGQLIQTISNPTPGPDDAFSIVIAAVGESVLVGAPKDDNETISNGTAYLFDGPSGVQLRRFVHPSPALNAQSFAFAVASLGGSLAIGSPQEPVSGQSDAGKVHLFRTSNGTHLFSVSNPTPASSEYFGEWLAGANGIVVTGVPRALGDSNGINGVGMVYAIAENRPPTVSPSSVSTSEDVPLDIVPSMTDPNGDTLTFHAVIGPFQGSVIGTSGEFTYTPNEAYSGPDAFQFYANDGCKSSANAQITITVNPINDPPVAVNDGPYVVNEDGLLTVGINTGVLDNDSDEDSASFTAVLNQDVANGTLTLNANGSFSYTPDPNFSGTDSFTYHALDDGSLSSNIATATITVNPLNDAPTAVADAYATNEDVPLVVGASGVLVNDSDPDPGAVLKAVLQTGVSNGSLSLSSNGNFTYTPAAEYSGPDSFTYRANDGSLNSLTVTVSINVILVNDTPVAANDAYAGPEDATVTVLAAAGVLANDSDPDSVETAMLVTDVTDGTLTLNANGSFTYMPDANFDGADSFTYRAVDGNTQSAVTTVSIDLTPVNDAPVAVADAYNATEDTTLTRNAAAGVLVNDGDVDSASLVVTLMVDVTDGTLTLNADGSFTYVPDANFAGSDSFTYRVGDGVLNSATVAVALTIAAVNDLPVAAEDAYTIAEDGTLDITAGVLLNDGDIENATLAAELVTNVAHGTLTLDADGTFLYQPAADYFGPDAFQYRATDGVDPSQPVTVAIDVTPVNDAPTVPALQSPPGGSLVEPDAVVFVWLASDDAEDDAVSYLVELSKDGAVVSNLPSMATTVALPAGTTLSDGTYSWRVQASDAIDDSAFSAPFTFDVGGDGGGGGGGGCGCSIEARARPSFGAALISFAVLGLVVVRRRR